MVTLRKVIIDVVLFAFALLALAVGVKFFFFTDPKTPEKNYQHSFDSVATVIQLATQKIAYLDSSIAEINKNHDKREKTLTNNQNKINAEEKKLKSKPIAGVMSFADSVYLSEQKR